MAEIGIHTVFPDRLYDSLGYSELVKGLFPLVRHLSPDAIAISGYATKDSRVLQVLCQVKNIPMILMSETKADDTSRKKIIEEIKRVLIKRFSSALCGGAPHKEYLMELGMPAEQIFMGYDVVDNDYFRTQANHARGASDEYRQLPGLEDSSPFFLVSSRFIPRKNMGGLLEAYRLYREMVNNQGNEIPWRLVTLGDGDGRPALEELIRNKNLQGVALAGFRQIEEIPVYYGRAKAFIHPALQDQWGLVVNEAMASGLPVLVSQNCGCASDLVEHGINGYVFDPANAAQLAEYLLQISSDPGIADRMGRASFEKISHWGLDKFAEGLHGAAEIAWKG